MGRAGQRARRSGRTVAPGRARDCGQVLDHAEAFASFELGSVDSDAGPAQCVAHLLSVGPAADQDSDGAIGTVLEGRSDDLLDDRHLRLVIALAEIVQPGVGIGGRRPGRGIAGRVGDGAHQRVAFAREDPWGKTVLNQFTSLGAERKFTVSPQQFGPQVRQSLFADPEIAAHVGLAEPVYGLHRVSNHEHGAAVAVLPFPGHLLEQVELGARSVLELVDQDVAQPRVQALGQQ